jgi:hypothetical protein
MFSVQKDKKGFLLIVDSKKYTIDELIIKYKNIPDKITKILCSEVKEIELIKNFWNIKLVTPTVNEIIEPLNRVLNQDFWSKRSAPILARNEINIAMRGVNRNATAKFKANETDTSAVSVFRDGKAIGKLSDIIIVDIKIMGKRK